MDKDIQRIINKINEFRFNEENGFPDTDDNGSCEDMSLPEIWAIEEKSKGEMYHAIYDAYKLGYMRASGRIEKS